jgi:hypothetical protein
MTERDAAKSELLDGQASVESREGYVHVWHGRAARDVEEWEGLRVVVEGELPERGARLLFDSRDSDQTPSDVQAAIWNWLQTCSSLERVATLVQSSNLAVSVRMQGIAKGVRIRAFAEEDEAVGWLTGAS